MIQVFEDRIEFTDDTGVKTLRFNETRVNGVLVSEMPLAERQAYIGRTRAKLQRREQSGGPSNG